MEPFRPVVDTVVLSIVRERGAATPVDRESKIDILSVLSGRFDANGERRTVTPSPSFSGTRILCINVPFELIYEPYDQNSGQSDPSL